LECRKDNDCDIGIGEKCDRETGKCVCDNPNGCLPECEEDVDCFGDQRCLLGDNGRRSCQCNMPDDPAYDRCSEKRCNLCSCAPCERFEICTVRAVGRYNVGRDCNTGCTKDSDCDIVIGEECEDGICICTKPNGCTGECRSDRDCDQESGQECIIDLGGQRTCGCRCREDPETGVCESPCNECTNPDLFRDECGNILNHAGCYPPSQAQPEAKCTCFYKGNQRTCSPFPFSERCPFFHGPQSDVDSLYNGHSDFIVLADVLYGDVQELNCEKGCIKMKKALYYCDENRGMDVGLLEKHLKIAQDICNGYERCALQAIGGIFDVGDHWKFCQDSRKPYVLWLEFECTWPNKRDKRLTWRRREIEYKPDRFDVQGENNYNWKAVGECFGICYILDKEEGLSSKYTKDVRLKIRARIPEYNGGGRGRPLEQTEKLRRMLRRQQGRNGQQGQNGRRGRRGKRGKNGRRGQNGRRGRRNNGGRANNRFG